eukprot:CAMPEP_0169210164 /NCGR_PEP_ID=MMETSP1016-20121227/15066_1 /TAXON_ID=342587 /ORGANISM="Karlodinium micrum, Strain CCMP2283" /LENGTH=102 /DNA_ID=CAMNT_0009287681 /DNA_START=108 /DNA_END=413 /DNA_ORIENTATION=+
MSGTNEATICASTTGTTRAAIATAPGHAFSTRRADSSDKYHDRRYDDKCPKNDRPDCENHEVQRDKKDVQPSHQVQNIKRPCEIIVPKILPFNIRDTITSAW